MNDLTSRYIQKLPKPEKKTRIIFPYTRKEIHVATRNVIKYSPHETENWVNSQGTKLINSKENNYWPFYIEKNSPGQAKATVTPQKKN